MDPTREDAPRTADHTTTAAFQQPLVAFDATSAELMTRAAGEGRGLTVEGPFRSRLTRGTGHIAQAHRPGERITDPTLQVCDRFVRRLADRLLV
jgi:hypothetical protein